jgi:hypothetical protein
MPIAQWTTKNVAHYYFDNILGMSPRTAYIFSYLAISTGVNLGAERLYASLTAEQGVVSDFDPDNPQERALIKNEKYGYNSFGGGPDSTNPEATANWVAAGKLKVVEGANGNVALAGERPYLFGSVHIGANSPNFPKALNMKYPSSIPFSKGTTFGFCHQAANASLLEAGFSNVVTETSGNFSTYITTFIYGNYGGGLVQKAYNGYQADKNWGRQ